MLGELNERAISLEEVREAENEMKSVKASGLDGFPVECLKKMFKEGGMAVLEWLVRLLNLIFHNGVVPMDWRGVCIVTNVNVATLEVLVC